MKPAEAPNPSQPLLPPIEVVHLFPELDALLFDLLESLSPEDWKKPTLAKRWTVKDVAAHLLDGSVRILSLLRDGHAGERPDGFSHAEIVAYLNRLNGDWVQAMKRVSPSLLLVLLKATGPLYSDYYRSLDPFGKALLSVSWAGEEESRNWMHIARDYTEKWLHQQQIRDAVGRPGLLTRRYFHPLIQTFLRALPHAYRDIAAPDGTGVKVTVTSEIGDAWFLLRDGGKWVLAPDTLPPGIPLNSVTTITLDPDTAWKLFSKGLRPDEVRDRVTVSGDRTLGEAALSMIAVMA